MTEAQKMPFKTKLFDAGRIVFKLAPLENLLVRMKAGKKPNSFAYRLIPRVYSYSPGTWRTTDRNGIKMKLDISNYVDHAVYFCIGDPGFEKLKEMVKPDWLVIDVGANIGATVLTFSKLAYRGRVIGFEPNKRNFSRLAENISLNGADNVSLHNVGLGEKQEELRLFVVDQTNPGMNRILNETDAATKDFVSETISIQKLDDFIVTEDLQRTDLIKIDVEGFEYNVLKGALKILSDFCPVLFIEINNDNLLQNGTSAKELVLLLVKQGYSICIASPWMPIDEQYNFDHCHFDILCIHTKKRAAAGV